MRTVIHLNQEDKSIVTQEIPIKRGIFQGDSLSALWFCLALNPLSNILKQTKHGYQIRSQKRTLHTINHLFYMDDIKIYARTKPQLESLIHIISTFSDDIHMQFGNTKCKTTYIERGKWKEIDPIQTTTGEYITNMSENETYKYLH